MHDIATWAKDASSDSPNVYWLFGPAGSGKSTIAFTIAHQFGSPDTNANTVTLGADFFCSRQFDETKELKRIVRTIAYRLSLVCAPFAHALSRSSKFDAIDHDCKSQIKELLVKPWQASDRDRAADLPSPPSYLVIIDALDEIDDGGGSEFLRTLFDVLNKGELQGLKFFATSRPHHGLVSEVNSFETKRLYRLQDVDREEVTDDIRIHLSSGLPHFAKRQEIGILAGEADGLFIYAATVVRYLEKYKPPEQERLLARFLDSGSSSMPKRCKDDATSLDTLYSQILFSTFDELDEEIQGSRLRSLYALLCTVERTSTSLVAELLSASGDDDISVAIVDAVLEELHAVLYTEKDQVLSYHKSFSDFLFHEGRSKNYWCDQVAQHRSLAKDCFLVMKAKLKFNIANIPSSFILDRDDQTLSTRVEDNIPAVLRYACRNWHRHLCFSATTASDGFRGDLVEFIQLRAVFWIEAMNLLGSVGQCEEMFREASKWVGSVSHTS